MNPFDRTLQFLLRGACIALLAAAAMPVLAQYPAKPIRLVIPFAAGGSIDAVARVIAAHMGQTLGQPVVVDSKPGADGVIAGDAVAKAQPDGYTLLLGSATGLSYAPAARKTMPYDAVADFTPIGQIGEFGFFLYTNSAVPAGDLREFVEHAKSSGNRLNHGATTSTGLLMSTLFAKAQRFEFVQVPYKGDAQLAPDLLTGRVHFAFASAVHLPHARTGSLRVLATTLPARSPLMPEAPTWAEAGLAPLATSAWAGLFGPAKMPPDVTGRLSRALAAALEKPDVREKFAALAAQPRPSTPEQLAVLVKDQLAAWRNAAQAAGVQPE